MFSLKEGTDPFQLHPGINERGPTVAGCGIDRQPSEPIRERVLLHKGAHLHGLRMLSKPSHDRAAHPSPTVSDPRRRVDPNLECSEAKLPSWSDHRFLLSVTASPVELRSAPECGATVGPTTPAPQDRWTDHSVTPVEHQVRTSLDRRTAAPGTWPGFPVVHR